MRRPDDSTGFLRHAFASTLGPLLLAFALLADGAAAQPAFELEGIGRVVAISDIHGAHQAFVETLQAAGVVDASGTWAAGRTHLVIVGDIVDRGDDSRAAMDLLMRLEPQAATAGGRVQVVLGNHELMNLVGDLRYVAKGEFAAFAAEEPAAVRDAAYARLAQRAPAGQPALSRAEFDVRFPPGFFAHRAAFAASGKYGRWLLDKPLALRVNDTLFVHAGLSPAFATSSLQAINGPLRDEVVEYAKLLEELTVRGLVDPTIDFYDVAIAVGSGPAAVPAPAPAAAGEGAAPAAATAVVPPAEPDPRVQRLLALQASLVHSPQSPLWYRGNAGCGPLVEQERLARALQSLGGRRVVVGHTPTYRRQVWRRLNDQVWLIDAGMQRAYYAGQGAALVLEGNTSTAIYQDGGRPVAVDALDDRAGALSADLSPAELEAALAGGEIVAHSPAPTGDPITLRWKGNDLQALFRPAAGTRGPYPEVAAYRLDRLLGLAMVPAAVVRSIGGRPGSLQHLPANLVTEAKRAVGEVRIDPWCPLKDQWQALYLFDALIFNAPRTAEDVLYVAASGQLVLTGHQAAFGTDTGIPPHLKTAALAVNGTWRLRLAALESPEARSQLLEVLTKRQYEAMLKRARVLAK